MKRSGAMAACVLGILAAHWATADLAGAEEPTVKGLMGENFAAVQTILVALITSNYAALPGQLDRVEEHASDLATMVPANAEANRDRFLTYAYNLRAHASDLKSIVEVLMEHDKGKEQLAVDSLREAAAAHYGGMVTMCVACHNQFRPKLVP